MLNFLLSFIESGSCTVKYCSLMIVLRNFLSSILFFITTNMLTFELMFFCSNGVPQPADKFHAIANVNKSSDSVRIEFRRVTAHPNYGGLVDNDIAVFKTSEPITFSDHVKRICIAKPNTFRYAYWNATAMGWGKVNRDRSKYKINEFAYKVHLFFPQVIS